ncbi:DEAD/DEAH box helicase [Providencia rettgeri]|uniref:DEAD/DEAH box helicase n=1 Tax=Providencia rettgeri TaxID=587 RepID=UPI00384DF87D
MKLNADREKILANPEAGRLLSLLNELDSNGQLILSEAELYFDFPLYKDDDDQLVISPLMLVSRLYGIIIFYLSTSTDRDASQKLLIEEDNLDNIYGQIFSRLVKQKNLRQTKKTLKISVESCIYAPHLTELPDLEIESDVITSKAALEKFIIDLENSVDENVYNEAASTIEGGKGLIRQKTRDIDGFSIESKVVMVNNLESAISRFDAEQLSSCVNEVDGIERIRGLAGSGKTVVLAMKVAITHLRNPDKKILYTFSTKALYQHVKRLITRFYRQFDDIDPDFDNSIKIMHAWGGTTTPGVYYNACINNDAPFLDFGRAQRANQANPFSYACKSLIEKYDIHAEYDYVFVDEAQDFDSNFLQLCLKLAQNENMVFGLDVFQNIFQTTAPSINEILGKDRKLGLDKFLNKCYRTPCATLVCAHAIGLGVYKDQVQVIRTPEDWMNLGYTIDESKYKNQFEANENIIVYRTEQASPSLYHEDKTNLVVTSAHEDIFEECGWVAKKINSDINEQGLNPSDILIICADDRNYKAYYSVVSSSLSEYSIDINNVNADRYNINDFSIDNKVTYSTIHKAKGNESYSVYVVGCESLYHNPNVKNRNLLFTAMTRTKGWLSMTGIGTTALELFDEISEALDQAPYLKFNYPPDTKIRQIEIDLKRIETGNKNNELEKLIQEFGAEGLKAMIREAEANKVKKK